MTTIIEVWDDNNQAQARIIEVKQANAKNTRLLTVSNVTLFDRLTKPGNPASWSTGDGKAFYVVQFETD